MAKNNRKNSWYIQMTHKSNMRKTDKRRFLFPEQFWWRQESWPHVDECVFARRLYPFFFKKYLVITTYLLTLLNTLLTDCKRRFHTESLNIYTFWKYSHVIVPLSSIYFKSLKHFFTKNPEAAPIRVRNKWTATVVRPNPVADPWFPQGGCTNSKDRCERPLSGHSFPKNCMKMKEFLTPAPLRSANDDC